MKMPGAPDPLYVKARRVLLDALEALKPHLDAVVLVGAQAIYVHTGAASDLAVAEYTTDADFALTPADLDDSPLLEEALGEHHFKPGGDPGRWISPEGVYVDVMVPEALAGQGRRSAELTPHGKQSARRAKGLEGALVDRDKHTIASLEPDDRRSTEMWVAGAGALLVAKLHKIAERAGAQDRVRDKDALDIFRLLRAVPTPVLVGRLRALANSDLAGDVTEEAMAQLNDLFASTGNEGVAMIVRAAGTDEDASTIEASAVALVNDLLGALEWRP
jgi:hypothetical protein